MYRLLIIDDEQKIRDGMQLLINWKRYGITQIQTAASYEEAVEKAIDFKPHIALVDVRVGPRWGYHIIERLNEIGLDTLYIMISGYDDFEYVRRSLLAGARDYLLKPVKAEELEKQIGKLITTELKGTLQEPSVKKETADPILSVEYSQLSNLVNKVLLIIKSEYGHSLDLSDIADMFNMNSKYIGRIFLRETHMKFSEYLLAYRMYRAREMIETTSEKILYIASKVGYPHINNFYSHFKSYYGVSPTEIRRAPFLPDPETDSL